MPWGIREPSCMGTVVDRWDQWRMNALCCSKWWWHQTGTIWSFGFKPAWPLFLISVYQASHGRSLRSNTGSMATLVPWHLLTTWAQLTGTVLRCCKLNPEVWNICLGTAKCVLGREQTYSVYKKSEELLSPSLHYWQSGVSLSSKRNYLPSLATPYGKRHILLTSSTKHFDCLCGQLTERLWAFCHMGQIRKLMQLKKFGCATSAIPRWYLRDDCECYRAFFFLGESCECIILQ